MNKMYSFDEIALIPKAISNINHRYECSPLDKNGKLPIFVSPMTCILNETNFNTFIKHPIYPIFPVYYNKTSPSKYTWKAQTFNEASSYYVNRLYSENDYILIDTANGNMQQLFDLVKLIKKKYPSITIMIGNIANYETYKECCYAGVDYVRIGVGGGSGCTTSALTGMHSSIPWMLENIKKFKEEELKSGNPIKFTKIVADGGLNRIDKAIKALALGADYVMLGKLFAMCEESASDIYYGQASLRGQEDRFGKIVHTPEGTEIPIIKNTNLSEFLKNFSNVLCSAMSYAGAKTLEDFIGKVDYQIQSLSEFNNYYKL